MSNAYRFGLASLLIVALAGCGGSDSESSTAANQSESSNTEETSTAQTSNSSVNNLTGVWLGMGYLDDELLNQKLAGIADEATRQAVLAKANSFRSMRIGFAYNDDASYQQDIAIVATNGQQIRGETTGTWKVVHEDGTMITIEQHDSQSDAPDQEVYEFVDADHFAMVPPVAEELLDCNPIVYFERQVGIDLTDEPDASTANATGTGETNRN